MEIITSPCASANSRQPGARIIAVVGDQLGDHAGRIEAGQPRQIDCRLGVPGTLQHAAGHRAQRETHAPGG